MPSVKLAGGFDATIRTMFKQSVDKTTAFSTKTKQFIEKIQQTKKPVQTPMHSKSGYLCFEKLTRRAQKLSTPDRLTLANWKIKLTVFSYLEIDCDV